MVVFNESNGTQQPAFYPRCVFRGKTTSSISHVAALFIQSQVSECSTHGFCRI